MTGLHVATPVFDAASELEIQELLEFAGLDRSGKVQLYDGRSGEPFSEKVTVGIANIAPFTLKQNRKMRTNKMDFREP